MNFKEKFKKTLCILLIISLVGGYSLPASSFAEGETSAEQPQTQIDNLATVENSTTASSDTGNNTINETPTPTDSAPSTDSGQASSLQAPDETSQTPASTSNPVPDGTGSNVAGANAADTSNLADATPTESPTIEASNSADVENNLNSEAVTGENSIDTGTDVQDDPPAATSQAINTGDAVSVAEAENSINSTAVNSNVLYQTINIFDIHEGDINLSSTFSMANDIITKDKNSDSVINVSVSGDNYAYLTNAIVSIAQSGENSINTTGDAIINTGNAYSIVSLLNKVNFMVVDSTVHVITINIFGKFKGNIILPDINSSTNCNGCGISVSAQNSATVENSVESTADTGQNSITASGSADIETGQSQSAVNMLNLINSNYINVSTQSLYITTFGNWTGNFIGWGNIPGQSGTLIYIYYTQGGGSESLCETCVGGVDVNNSAFVQNSVSSYSNTGGNSITGANSKISTGKAFSSVSVINFINSNFINSFGFFGFINIFGSLVGDIGGESNFKALENNNPPQQSSTSSSGTELEDGYLEISQTNNVGEYVLPGDTVTFFIKVKNPGNGDVHDTKLWLSLIKDGVNAGGGYFDIGNISPSKGVGVTTGFVLSQNAPAGNYTARAYVEGITGENSNTVSAYADSGFDIFGYVSRSLVIQQVKAAEDSKGVLGNKTPERNNKPPVTDYTSYQLLGTALILALVYLLLKKTRKNPRYLNLLAKNINKYFKKGGE